MKNVGSVRNKLSNCLEHRSNSNAQLRAGTQTLIQAIQALPWTDEPEGDDEAIPPTALNSDSSDDERSGVLSNDL